ncbi:MAG: nickel-responsive transcriptional regulator NikR [Smithellaceae bacterium]|nr:nickel-responsive transcriptional regulator NikR [Syntrophaceae bacterium]MDD4241533.1 nickel-responsive transcriptional regulator NikR [Smithellaceae bacterium]NLX51800.1 nickel-responsive transcriptional regulator NikR [Deltaproteobacteria bacterium]
MSKLVRFGVSLDEDLLNQFDRLLRQKKYTNRSEAIRDLIREELVKKEWTENREVTGAITLVYDHHARELVTRVLDIQHDYHTCILSSQHIHLDHHNCFEIIVTRGKSKDIEALFQKLKAVKNVKHAGFMMATRGKHF